jgi:hypothetical protein
MFHENIPQYVITIDTPSGTTTKGVSYALISDVLRTVIAAQKGLLRRRAGSIRVACTQRLLLHVGLLNQLRGVR